MGDQVMPRFRMRASLWAAMLLVATAGVVSQGLTASATTTPCTRKCALGTLAPAAVGAGSTSTITFSLKNEANPQSIGSADLTAPSGFVLQSQPAPTSSTGSATISSGGTTLE